MIIMKIQKGILLPAPGNLKMFLLLILPMLILSACSSDTPDSKEKIYAFRNISVIDAVNGQRDGQDVIVTGKRITQTGRAGEISIPRGAMSIDGSGKFMIPGLWDAHVHLSNSDAAMPELFPLFVANGILYVRDTGATLESILDLRGKAKEALDSEGMAPHIFITGPHIDGMQLSWVSSVSAGTVEQARLRIDTLMKAGVNEIKVYDLIPRDVALEVFSIAKEHNYPLCAHVPLAMDVVEASNAGLTSMEHMYNLEMACSADWDSLLTMRRQMIAEGKEKSGQSLREGIYRAQRLHSFRTQDNNRRDTVLNTLAKNGTWQVPTLVIIAQEEHRMYNREDWKKTYRYLPASIRNRWEQEAARKSSQTPSEEGLAHAGWAYDMVKRLADAGIGIMAGTDMPLSFLTPAYSLHEELALLVQAGLTPLQALESATLKPAEYFGIENRQGAIAEGMLADLVILDANPLDDIRNTSKINTVMTNGHLHTREALNTILNQLENSMVKHPE